MVAASVVGRLGGGIAAGRGTARGGGPPVLTGGVKAESAPSVGRLIGLDWVTIVGSEGRRPDAVRVLERYFGRVVETGRGQYFCQTCWKFEGGAKLHFGHSAGVCVVEVSGRPLAGLDGWKRVEFLREIIGLLGFKVTRLDVALDFVFCELELCARVLESCQAGQLCHAATTWKPERSFRGSVVVSDGVTIGLKGDAGSGRQWVVYDKGLEQRERGEGVFWKAGEWERIEARFWDERANQAALQLLEAFAVSHWRAMEVMRGLALGAVDFRERVAGRVVRECPRVAWWRELLGSTRAMFTFVKRRAVDLLGYASYLRKQVMPRLRAVGDAVGLGAGQLLEMLAGEGKPGRTGPILMQFRQWVVDGADAAELGYG